MKVYQFLSEIADRRTKKYKELDKKLDELVLEFGKNSNEVNDFFNSEIKPETIEDIFNDPEFREIFDFETEKKELESVGWNYQDIQEAAKFVIKNTQ